MADFLDTASDLLLLIVRKRQRSFNACSLRLETPFHDLNNIESIFTAI